VFWGHSLADLRMRVKLRFGFEHARAVQEFTSVLKVAALVFGGGGKEKGAAPPNMLVAKAALASVVGG